MHQNKYKDNGNAFGLATRTVEHVNPEPPRKLVLAARKLLLDEKSEDVVKKVIEIALTDGAPLQGAMLKMCFERALPISEFEAEGAAGIKTVIIDRSCGGKVIIKTGNTTVETDIEEYEVFQNGE